MLVNSNAHVLLHVHPRAFIVYTVAWIVGRLSASRKDKNTRLIAHWRMSYRGKCITSVRYTLNPSE